MMSDGFSMHDSGHGNIDPIAAALSLSDLYVHQTPILDPVLLLDAFLRAQMYEGPALLHIYSPDPVRDGIPVEDSLTLARIALESRVFPSILRVPGSEIDFSGNPRRLDNGPSAGTWMLGQERFSDGFEFVPRRDWSSDQVALQDWLLLAKEGRIHSRAFVERKRPDGLTSRYLTGNQVTRFSISVEKAWTQLTERKLSGHSPQPGTMPLLEQEESSARTAAEPGSSSRSPDPSEQNPALSDALTTLTDKLFTMSGFGDAHLTLADWTVDKQLTGAEPDDTE